VGYGKMWSFASSGLHVMLSHSQHVLSLLFTLSHHAIKKSVFWSNHSRGEWSSCGSLVKATGSRFSLRLCYKSEN